MSMDEFYALLDERDYHMLHYERRAGNTAKNVYNIREVERKLSVLAQKLRISVPPYKKSQNTSGGGGQRRRSQ